MSDVIQLLPDAIANQIAAGEVVQRPASVVKELMENAIDAGGSSVKVIIKDSGKSLIRIIDDGCGMSETDARLSFERHATSKIREAKDLFAIRTMGFRGEAMASIAAIAQVELKTKRQNDELGTLIVIEGSEVKRQEACQCTAGTSIAVKNLFYNVPARRQFLKSDAVEMRHIVDEFQRIALAHPDIFFSLHHNHTEVFHLPKTRLRQRVVGVFGQAYNQRLVPVREETDILSVDGYVGKPEYSKKTRGDQYFFVNNRFIKSGYLHHAVMTAFGDLLPKDTYPLYAIFIEIDSSRIDINVHPTKQEIKFDDERLVYQYLKVAVRHALGQHAVIPTLDFEGEAGMEALRKADPSLAEQIRPHRIEDVKGETSNRNPSNSGAGGNYQIPSDKHREANNLRHWQDLYEGLGGEEESTNENKEAGVEGAITINSNWDDDANLGGKQGELGKIQSHPYQIHGSYIVSPIKNGFMLIDQQAAHERILFEQYLETLEERRESVQAQLFPRTLQLAAADANLLTDILDEINQLGFDVQPFGKNAFVVNGVPASAAGKIDEESLIDDLLGQYRHNLELKLGVKENVARSLARSAAKKKGQALDRIEMKELIDRLFACEQPFKSPFGRKCFLKFELEELDRRFSA